LVESLDPTVKITPTSITGTTVAVDTTLRGQNYYWRVVSNYAGGIKINGDLWSFVTRPYEIVFNTSTQVASYQGNETIPALGVVVHGNGWYSLRADGNSTNYPGESDVIGHIGTDGVVIYDFNTFNFDKRFDITVIPAYRGQDITASVAPRPIAIHVNNGGSFYFDGKIRIQGDSVSVATGSNPFARAGGFVGPRPNSGSTGSAPDSLCWTNVDVKQPYYHRFGTTLSDKTVYVTDSNCYTYFGPGIASNPPYKGGSGGSYGGSGGICGRAYFYGMKSGKTYGDEEVPVPFGGSGGGWNADAAGTSGGGGIEIVAAGNVVLDSNSEIRAKGGDCLYAATNNPSGGGSGGSVKIIAGNAVTVKGIIDVSGGTGGDTGKQANEAGGGGGGGRVAIFANTIDISQAVINRSGGGKGVYSGSVISLADNGQSGTLYTAAYSLAKKASAPTPSDNDNKFYVAPGTTTIPLKWYSGYGASTDEVYFGTNTASLTKVGATVTASRGQHTSTANVTVATGLTYYFKVITDGSVTSDVWSFKIVNWECPFATASTATTIKYAAGPTWDNNGDCILSNEDIWYFAKDWQVARVSGNQTYTITNAELLIVANEWMECVNRTNSGCAGW
jgi:hypothetical protein